MSGVGVHVPVMTGCESVNNDITCARCGGAHDDSGYVRCGSAHELAKFILVATRNSRVLKNFMARRKYILAAARNSRVLQRKCILATTRNSGVVGSKFYPEVRYSGKAFSLQLHCSENAFSLQRDSGSWDLDRGIRVHSLFGSRTLTQGHSVGRQESFACAYVLMEMENYVSVLRQKNTNRKSIRSSTREWLEGFAMKLDRRNAYHAELWGVYRGLRLAWELGFRKIDPQIDDLLMVNVISSQQTNPYVNSNLITYIKMLLHKQ
ncbi:Ribonuclease H domain - like 10 [Theobroma cacao]|nr:Ribonuclease H domain - like 10 [Theobroma cacao]